MPAPHEPLLERELTRGRGHPGAEAVVGRRQDRGSDAERPREAGGHRRERLAAPQCLGARQVQPEVPVAELEPGLRAEAGRRLARVPALAGPAPAALLVEHAGEGVEDRVEVRRDMQADDLEVVADVADNGHVRGVDRLGEGAGEARAAEPAGENGDLHGEAARRPSSAAAVCGPRRPSSRSKSASVSTSAASPGTSALTKAAPSRSARARNRSALPGP